ncbi:gamma-glutamyl-gamma-aminobutyrate hydrolase family protein [Pedobacter sp. GR22-6]|uniref:gamma-glutamyl-gamma-aminobutyrate hydrolase family protein n=1 Tax=Pedobacter sp. GR22-6 TaxID=3127957 RepID=UPI00307ECE4E
MKKYIGISYSESNFSNYWDWFEPDELQDDLELINLSYLKNNQEDFQRCAGFVLTGGVDVLPAISGAADQYPNMPAEFLPERDEFERAFYLYSQEQRLPLLGICRGMQYINILEGGKLLDDLGVANAAHRRLVQDKQHGISLEPGTLLQEITGLRSGSVNSAHHQAVDPGLLADSLMISAWSESQDRIAEAIEFKHKAQRGFMLGVQWHPERMQEKASNPLSQAIKARFLAELRKL